MAEKTAAEIAEEEAQALLSRPALQLPAAEIEALEREKRELVARIAATAPVDAGPRANRRGSHRPSGLPDIEEDDLEPAAAPARQVTTAEAPVTAPAPVIVDLEAIDPMRLAELAEAAKAAKKRLASIEHDYHAAREDARAAEAELLAYLQRR